MSHDPLASRPYPPISPTLIGTQRSAGLWIVLTILTLGIAAYVWTYKTHDEMERYSGRGLGGVVGVIIYFLFAPATFFLVPSELRSLYITDGQVPPIDWKWGLWFLLPIIGGLIWFLKVQRLLNEFWGAKGAPPA